MVLLQYMIVIGLSITPALESRLALVYGMSTGLNPLLTFIISITANILILILFLYLLKKARFSEFIRKYLGKHIAKTIDKNKNRFTIYKELGLVLLVSIPLPGTGAYTAALVSDVLKFNKKRSLLFISLGIILGNILILLGLSGAIQIFNFII